MILLESELQYGVSYAMSDEAMSENFVLPIGVAKIMRAGSHITLVSYSRPVQLCLKAAEEMAKQGVECEVSESRK